MSAVCWFFFTAEPVVERYSQVMACDVERFRRFFHGMLGEGIYSRRRPRGRFLSRRRTPPQISTPLSRRRRVFFF